MGVRILFDREQDMAALYCSTSMVAVGPVFGNDEDGHDADERAEAFCRWLPEDARRYTDAELQGKYAEWLAQEAAQWQAEDDAKEAEDAEDDEIAALRVTAIQQGDLIQVRSCDLALTGDVPARAACNRTIRKAYIATMKVIEG